MCVSKWVQGLPINGVAVPPTGEPITSIEQFLGQFTVAELATCPVELLPTFEHGGVRWPDVCHCNGQSVHEAGLPTCNPDVEEECSCAGERHVEGCPFDMCPVAQCHPLCYQVTGHGEDIYCHCPCHG